MWPPDRTWLAALVLSFCPAGGSFSVPVGKPQCPTAFNLAWAIAFEAVTPLTISYLQHPAIGLACVFAFRFL